MLELLFQGLVEWVYGLIMDIWQYTASTIFDIISMDYTYLETHIPIIPDIAHILVAVGWALLLGNLAFQALKSMMVGLGFEAEDPALLFTRTFVFSFLLLASPEICEIGLSITQIIIDLLSVPNATRIQFASESFFAGLTAAWLMVIICGIFTMIHTLKLIIEIAERYIILGFLTMCAPLAFAMGGSKATSDIFTGWCRMFGSMCFVMVSNMMFLKMLLSVLSTVPSGLDALPWMVLVFGIVKVAKKVDGIITRIGLNPAITGDSLGRAVPGMLTYMVMRTAANQVIKAAGKSTAKTGATGTKNSTSNTSSGGRSASYGGASYASSRGGGATFSAGKSTGATNSTTQNNAAQNSETQNQTTGGTTSNQQHQSSAASHASNTTQSGSTTGRSQSQSRQQGAGQSNGISPKGSRQTFVPVGFTQGASYVQNQATNNGTAGKSPTVGQSKTGNQPSTNSAAGTKSNPTSSRASSRPTPHSSSDKNNPRAKQTAFPNGTAGIGTKSNQSAQYSSRPSQTVMQSEGNRQSNMTEQSSPRSETTVQGNRTEVRTPQSQPSNRGTGQVGTAGMQAGAPQTRFSQRDTVPNGTAGKAMQAETHSTNSTSRVSSVQSSSTQSSSIQSNEVKNTSSSVDRHSRNTSRSVPPQPRPKSVAPTARQEGRKAASVTPTVNAGTAPSSGTAGRAPTTTPKTNISSRPPRTEVTQPKPSSYHNAPKSTAPSKVMAQQKQSVSKARQTYQGKNGGAKRGR